MAQLPTNYTDGDATATVHAVHHNALALAANSLPHPLISGRYYSNAHVLGTIGSGTQNANVCTYVPAYFAYSVGVDQVCYQTQSTVGSAGSLVRIGLHGFDMATGLPSSSPLYDWGTVAQDAAAGIRSLTVSGTVPAGWVYFALCTNGVTPGNMNRVTVGSLMPTGSTFQTSQSGALSLAATGGNLPSIPGTLAGMSSGNVLHVNYRVA